MHNQSRPPNRSHGSTAVTAGSGVDPPTPVVVAGAAAQNSSSEDVGERSFGHGGEPDSPSWCRTKASSPVDSGVFHIRSHLPRRISSGYISSEGDSLPSSPLSPRPLTADRATQTPSPTGQLMKHALQRMAEAHGGATGTRRQHGQSLSPFSTRYHNPAGAMEAEIFGRELRRIGDDFNTLLLLRGMAGGHRRVEIRANLLPHIQQEPTTLLCVGLLLLLIGRLIYLRGSANSQDHAQV